jgi:hypothetical protein
MVPYAVVRGQEQSLHLDVQRSRNSADARDDQLADPEPMEEGHENHGCVAMPTSPVAFAPHGSVGRPLSPVRYSRGRIATFLRRRGGGRRAIEATVPISVFGTKSIRAGAPREIFSVEP